MLTPILLAIYIFGMGIALQHGWSNKLQHNEDEQIEVIVYHIFNVVIAIIWPLMIFIGMVLHIIRKVRSWEQ